ncbi:protein brambleberry-like [Zootermopsis nevadensis]|uniref:Protein brambleberry n=1 Tax=Zootermopsis nevadensis TaxID=136037 RepID=A0A067RHP8_ZOONE|nr:protein brambleberry-like [Zootermopsis nevadensis]KDR18720.1 hypothetical protein L798_07030 [Zootermopsis nevadensis]
MLVLEHPVRNRRSKARLLCLFVILIRGVDSSVLDWVWGSSKENADPRPKVGDAPVVKVPFEVTAEDEKFLQEAKKYTNLKLSDLDSCQHHIVMKIRNSCSDMTEEELAKMSVNLLNCQSAVEGRKQFPCTKSMTLRECTSSMDPDMWNTYHLMNNRARAVCYAARHQQFRALSELTVNKLMDSAQSQLNTMNSLKDGQQKLEVLTSNTMESVSLGHKSLMDQQEKLRVTQRNIQDFVALNLRELTREKALIAAGHREIAKMTEDVKKKLDEASSDLSSQVNERRENHKQLLEDLDTILDQVSLIWKSIDHSTQEIIAQHASAAAQYNSTLHKLAQINITVNYLLNLLDKTRQEIDERLGWLTSLIGDTGNQLGHVYSCVLHALYLIVGMIAASFVRAPTLTRAFLLVIVPLNLAAVYHHGDSASLDFLSMTILIFASTAVHCIIQAVLHYWTPRQPGPIYYLHGSQSPPVTNGFVPSPLSPVKPVASVLAQKGFIEKLRCFTADMLRGLKSLVSSLINRSKSVSAADSPIGNTRFDKGHRIPTPVSDEDIGDDSSDSDEVASQDNLQEGLTHYNGGSSDFLNVHSGIPPLRQRSSTPLYTASMRVSSRSGTPRPMCLAICRNGQQCRNSASLGSDVCRRHAFDSSFR